MTTVSEIITDAYRKSNLIPIGTSPSTDQQTEALRYINRIVMSVLGNEAGENLEALAIGRNGIVRPSGYPYYDTEPTEDFYVPLNTKLFLNLLDPFTVYLHPDPEDGSRFSISDVSDNLSTNSLTVSGNGRTIEDGASIVLSTDGLNREWFYRQDLGNWQRVTDLALVDAFPFPLQYDEMFIVMLAMSLNPSYGATIDSQSLNNLNRLRNQFRSRYENVIEVPTEEALIRLPRISADRDSYRYSGYYGTSTDRFNRGRP